MFKKSGHQLARLFKLWKKQKKSVENMLPNEALDLQKQSFINLTTQDADVCTPPYLIIASFLSSQDPQVVESAVYYLKRIAYLNPKLKNKIEETLNLNV